MKKFLGISYNKWHGILAFIAVCGVSVLAFSLFNSQWPEALGFTSVGAWIVGIIFADWLNVRNEFIQMHAKDTVSIYGSYHDFIWDSKQDTKWFWRGVLISAFPFFLYVAHL